MSATPESYLKKFAEPNLLTLDDLKPYQVRACEFMWNNPHSILTIPMGGGKTATTLTALASMLDDGTIKRALIVCTLRVAQTVWRQEASKWKHTGHLHITAALGTPKRRALEIESNSDITLINYDNISWFFDKYGADHPFDCIIWDDLSKAKSASTGRWRRIRKYAKTFDYRYGLTGTLTTHMNIEDIFAQMYTIEPSVFGKSFIAWREQYFHAIDFNRYKWALNEGSLETIIGAIEPYCFCINDAEYTDTLGPCRINPIDVKLPKEAYMKYIEFKKELVLELEESGKVLTADNMAALTQKLQQVVQGFVYDEDRKVHEIHETKKNVLWEIMDENQQQPLIVVYKFKEEERWLIDQFGAESLTNAKDVEDVIKRWNDGEIPVLALHPQSAGHGLNLQFGGSHMVWLGLPYSLDDFQQTIARIHRRGQDQMVWVHTLLAEGTIDSTIYAALSDKKDMQEAVMQRLLE